MRFYGAIFGFTNNCPRFPFRNCAEVCAATYKISRDEQDSHAEESYRRAAAANKAGLFKDEIVPVEIKNKGKAKTITVDDESTRSLEVMKIRQQKTVFKHALDAKIPSTVTGANASVISDGASALVLISGRTLKTLPEGVQKRVLGRVLSYADAALPPIEFTVAPAKAVPLALTKAGLQIKDINRFEINEAFSVVALANQRLLNIAPEDINVNGGAVALGHPLGSSGSRIIVTLLSTLKQAEQNLSAKGLKANLGVAAICNGGGGASAIVIERF